MIGGEDGWSAGFLCSVGSVCGAERGERSAGAFGDCGGFTFGGLWLEVFRGLLIAALRRNARGKGGRGNSRRSAVRSAVEHLSAGQKHSMGLGFGIIARITCRLRFIRTIGIARARIKIGMANLAYSFPRLAWLEGCPHGTKAGR